MKAIDRQKLSSAVLKKARELGADIAGIANFKEVKECPSAKAELKLPQMEVLKEEDSFESGKAYLPQEGRSVILVAISHPEEEPELDWRYDRYSTPGNQKLVVMVNNLIKWLKKNCFNCEGYCLQDCPRRAFDEIIYTSEEMGQDKLPGRRGAYDRLKCIKEIDRDKERARDGEVKAFHKTTGQMIYLIKHCRKCEFSCPVGG